jgi:hypothetical protein
MNKGMKRWIIPDGYLPRNTETAVESHEALCFLNTTEKEAYVTLIIYFEDREPIGGFELIVPPPRRTIHYIIDKSTNNDEKIMLRNTPYAIEIISNIEIGVQYTRVDTRQPNMALFTTMAVRTK